MAGRLALEQFGTSPPGAAEAAAQSVPECRPSLDDPAGADPDAPAPEPAEDPEQARAGTLSRVAAALDLVAARQEDLRRRCIADAAAALGAAAETLLPRLARAGFAAAVAETAAAIARTGRWPELTLRVAPADADQVAEALREAGAEPLARVVADAALAAGDARLDWAEGGAEIDVEAIAAAAAGAFDQRLAAMHRELDR